MSETKRGHLFTRMFTLFIWQYISCDADLIQCLWSNNILAEIRCSLRIEMLTHSIITIITRQLKCVFALHSISIKDIMICNCKVWRMYFWFSKCKSLFALYTDKKKSILMCIFCCFLIDSKSEFITEQYFYSSLWLLMWIILEDTLKNVSNQTALVSIDFIIFFYHTEEVKGLHEKNSYRFELTGHLGNYIRIWIFGWTIPLRIFLTCFSFALWHHFYGKHEHNAKM